MLNKNVVLTGNLLLPTIQTKLNEETIKMNSSLKILI